MKRRKCNRNVIVLSLIVLMAGLPPGCKSLKRKKASAPLPERGLRHVNLGHTFDQPAVTISGPAKDERFDDLELRELVAKDRVNQLYPLEVSFGRNQFGPWLRISASASEAYKELTITAMIRYQRKDYKLSAKFIKQENGKAWRRQTLTLSP